MEFADANRAQIRYIEEASFGVTPANGKTREVRLTSSSLMANKETVTSDELRSDRMVADIVEVSASSSGDINFEWSSGAQDEFLAAFLLSEWSRPMTMDFFKGLSIGITSTSAVTVYGRDVTGYLTAGQRIKLAGFSNAANNDYFEISTVVFAAGNTVITTTTTTFVIEAGEAASRLYDANDVIILKNTTLSTSAAGIAGAGNPFAAAIAAGQLQVGQKIAIQSTGANGVFKITSVSAGLLGLSPSPGIHATGPAVTIKGSHLRNSGNAPSIQQRYFSIETAYEDIGQFMEQDGMVPGTFSLEVATGAIITGTVGFEGRATSLRQTPLLGGAPYTVLDAQPGAVVNATTDVGDLVKDGAPLLACIQSISLSGEAGLRMQNCIGEKFPRGIGTGRFNLTGSMSVYFEDEELFADFINHETVSLEFSIKDAEGVSYYFTIPAMKISQDEIAPGGIDQDVLENIEFTAFRDATTDTMFQIDRFSPNS